MSGFSIDWLDLRENADRRARDSALRQRAIRWLQDGAPPTQVPVVVDLGAGTGSTIRALANPDPMPLTWRLVDHDRDLLAEALHRHGSTHQIETCHADLSHIDKLPLQGARLVTASALFDLVSAEFIETLTAALQIRASVAVYAALNYDGSTHWTPPHPMDDMVLRAFNQDQRQDKGFGPALGPEATACMHRAFSEAGFEVLTASSPWILDANDHHLVEALIAGIGAAVADSAEIDAKALEDWIRFRQSHVTTGTCTVGHTDVLALPR